MNRPLLILACVLLLAACAPAAIPQTPITPDDFTGNGVSWQDIFDHNESELYAKTRRIPASHYERNSYNYYLLHRINPEKDLYRTKFETYSRLLYDRGIPMEKTHYLQIRNQGRAVTLVTENAENLTIPDETFLRVTGFSIEAGHFRENLLYFAVRVGEQTAYVNAGVTDRALPN